MSENDLNINLEELDHQREALNAILDSFPHLDTISEMDKNGLAASSLYANPLIKEAFNENKFIDVKMETGTGKTYTYTRMMFELHERYGLFKFIIVVPSSAIKEGAKSFLSADYAKQHFKKFFPKIELFGNVGVIEAGDFNAKKKRKTIPNAIREFAEADIHNKNQIQVLLLNDKGFLDKATSSLFKDDYDANLFSGESSPANMLSMTRPVIIIDEPHRLKRDMKSYQNIINKLKPQMVVRFGATFPEKVEGRGKNKILKIDYFRGEPQYNLTATDSFNRDLVKGVAVYTPEKASTGECYKVVSATSSKLVFEKDNKKYEVSVGEALADVDSRFQGGLTYESKGLLSNELKIEKGIRLIADTFTNSYQELLLEQALDAHFKTERSNYLRDGYPVKTNALFFIDNIDSYRDRGTGQATWLKDTFEKILEAKLEKLIDEETSDSYREFLQATLDDIPNAHGGYFSSDSHAKTTDGKVSEEIDVILRNKAKSLRYKDERGCWNILRFFFSQWTLREGWDNPNVFTIAKLRSSGSDTSKIQEVGRGLRLPVDAMGNRLSNQEWWLNYVIDESEKDFADRLLSEINEDAVEKINKNAEIPNAIITKLIDIGYGSNKLTVCNRLCAEQVIDEDMYVIDVSSLRELLPKSKAAKKVRNGAKKSKKVKLVKSNWDQIKEFWREISKRYMITFDDISEEELLELFLLSICDEQIFDGNKTVNVVVQNTQKGETVTVSKTYVTIENLSAIGKLPYNKFVRNISRQTNLPAVLIHKGLIKRFSDLESVEELINERTLANIVNSWQATFLETYATKYHYDALDFKAKTSVLVQDKFVEDIAQGAIGSIEIDMNNDARNLFEQIFVDSESPEGEIARIVPKEEIVVFGKIPKRAIQVPTYTGGTTTPDFVYATKNNLYLLVEAKSDNLREKEIVAVGSQKIFFKNLENVTWSKVTKKDEVIELLQQFY